MMIISCCFCCFCTFLILLGVFGGIFYNNRSFTSTTSISLIQNPSLPLIGTINDISGKDSVRFVQSVGTDIVPVSFYALSISNCLSGNSFVSIPINETIRLGFGSLNGNSKEVTEWYMLNGSNINMNVDIETISDTASVNCLAKVIIFDDYFSFILFISEGIWYEKYSEVCITEKTSSINWIFNKNSYFYFGIYTDIPTEIKTVTLYYFSTYHQYDLSNAVMGCSISVTQTTCDVQLSEINVNSQSICFVGSVSSNEAILGLRQAYTDFYIATLSDTLKWVYFFLPLIITAALILLFPHLVCIILPFVICCCDN